MISCFGPHALTDGFIESRNRRDFVAQIPLISMIGIQLSVYSEIPQYCARLYQHLHSYRNERTCHLNQP
jgi:hypothetical protein